MTYTQDQRDALIATVTLADNLIALPFMYEQVMSPFRDAILTEAARLAPIVAAIAPGSDTFADRMLAALERCRVAQPGKTEEGAPTDPRLSAWDVAWTNARACSQSGMAESWRNAYGKPAPAPDAEYTECFTCGAPMGAHLGGCPESATAEPVALDIPEETEEERAEAAEIARNTAHRATARARVGQVPYPLACVACGTGPDMTKPAGGLVAATAPDGRLIALCFACQCAAIVAVAALPEETTIAQAAELVTEPAHIAALMRRIWLRPATIPTVRACGACGAFLPVFDTSPCPFCDPRPAARGYFAAWSAAAGMDAAQPLRDEYQRQQADKRAAATAAAAAYQSNDRVLIVATSTPAVVMLTEGDRILCKVGHASIWYYADEIKRDDRPRCAECGGLIKGSPITNVRADGRATCRRCATLIKAARARRANS